MHAIVRWHGAAPSRMLGPALIVLALLAGTRIAAQTFSSAVFQSGQLPIESLRSVGVGGGEVLVEVTVGRDGSVAAVRPLRETATFTERVAGAVKTWQFAPAEEFVEPAARRPGEPPMRKVESKVLVAGIFRPPTFTSPTLGEAIRNTAAPSEEVPFPITTVVPPFPPLARSPGVVLVEVRVDSDGRVAEAKVRQPSPGFDDAALGAARQWTFRPARVRGRTVASLVYIMFTFPMPVV